jgi:3D-(3,5/4)-trihydroxycyclohexane-1,2-dione acylhydrolase (decyclizing)
MLNSEIATSVALDRKLIIVLLDNRGFGCINRLQEASGGEPYNNLLDGEGDHPQVDFVAHARSLGAQASLAGDLDELSRALQKARDDARTTVIVINTDPDKSTTAGGAWWDVPVASVSDSEKVRDAYTRYRKDRH